MLIWIVYSPIVRNRLVVRKTNHALYAPIMMEGRNMAENNDNDIPFMQKLLDNTFLLLFLGVASPGLLYILWGIIDIMNVPLAK